MSETYLKIPLTAEKSGFPSKIPEVVINREKVFQLEQQIPLKKLYDAVKKIEANLKTRSESEGYIIWNDDLVEPQYPDEFAHIFEHAILAVVDNNLSSSQTFSRGRTVKAGFVDRSHPAYKLENERLQSHHHEIRLRLTPALPTHLHQNYVDSVMKQILEQYQQTGEIDLETIVLE